MSHRPTTHWTELPEDTTDGVLSREWNTYRRLVGQLLADGHENRWVLIVGEELIGMWDTYQAARAVADERYFLKPVMLKQILTHEPHLGRLVPRLRWPA